jgi:hypothetical protein
LYIQQQNVAPMQAAKAGLPMSTVLDNIAHPAMYGGISAVDASAFAATTPNALTAAGTAVVPLFKPSLSAEKTAKPAGTIKKRARFAAAVASFENDLAPAAHSSEISTGEIYSLNCFLVASP